jgi:hypothetical protein
MGSFLFEIVSYCVTEIVDVAISPVDVTVMRPVTASFVKEYPELKLEQLVKVPVEGSTGIVAIWLGTRQEQIFEPPGALVIDVLVVGKGTPGQVHVPLFSVIFPVIAPAMAETWLHR